jgi:acyl-CoA synthetase (AMP-forming)/AMP-acid ligase II/acyl carrier protein
MIHSSIPETIQAWAERAPAAVAVAAPGRAPLSYGRLRFHIEEVTRTLNAMGIGRKDRIALVLPNGPELAVAFLATASAAASAPLNPDCRAGEFDFLLADLRAKALLFQSGSDSPAIAVARKRGIPVIELTPVFAAEAGVFSLTGSVSAQSASGGFAQADDEALVLHTSGTTSRPKIVPLTQRNICTSARNVQTTLQLIANDRCLNVMPLFHIHGLVGAVLSSLLAGASVVCAPGFFAPDFFTWMEECRPTWYTAVPTIHQAILARAASTGEVTKRCPLRFIRSSSSALPPTVMTELEKAFDVPVIESYGMTEAAHQIASNPLPPRQRKAGSVGMAAGPELAIMDESGNVMSRGEKGEIVVRGANVTSGYESDPTANQKAFIRGWFRTGDQGFLDNDGYLFITGRLKEIINRGGEKISPREVDEVLLDHPAIAQVVTFAVPDAKLGEEVAAAVVLHKRASVTATQLREFAAARLSDYKVPRQVLFVEEIPKGPSGKLQRIGLAERLGVAADYPRQPEQKAVFVEPRTAVEKELARLWADVLGLNRVGVHDHFLDLGGDSLLAARLVSRIREQLRLELSMLSLFEAPTVSDQSRVVEEMLLNERR